MKRALAIILCLTLCAELLFAAIAYDAVGSGVADGTGTVTTASGTVGSTNTAMILVSMTNLGTPDKLTSAPKWNGSATGVTQIGSDFTESATFFISEQKYYLINPTSGSHAATFDSYDHSGGSHYGVFMSVTGADQTTPIRSSNRATVNNAMGTTSPSVTCASAQSGDLIVVVFAQLSASSSFATITGAGTLTLRDTSSSTTGIKGYLYTDTATGSYTATLTLNSARDIIIDCIDIAPATAAASGPPSPRLMLGVGPK